MNKEEQEVQKMADDATRKGNKLGAWIVGIILCIILYNCGGSSDSVESNEPKLSTRETRIIDQFSAWDGSHNNVTELILKAMNDPNSYEHDETRYGDKGDHLVIMTRYRGKNAFGGVVKNWVKVKVSIHDGTILEIIAEGP